MDYIDLFCGIGGFRLAMDSLGHTCVFSSEINKHACETYQANFNDWPSGDITQIALNTIPTHDILTAGFPCQAFSKAGRQLGFADTRGTLFHSIARIIDAHRPKAVLLENVRNLTTHDNGNTFKVITNALDDFGYEVYHKILNAKDFGLPQNRERIYIVAFRDPTDFTWPRPTNEPTRVGTILHHPIYSSHYTLSDKRWTGLQAHKQKHVEKGQGFGFILNKADDAYMPTLPATALASHLIEQPGQNPRYITPRECARLQGFPDDFLIPVSKTQAYHQFGNSVAVPVVRAIAQRITDTLNNPTSYITTYRNDNDAMV
jgi:DNA (cytosine-5)-methyltransferase 1